MKYRILMWVTLYPESPRKTFYFEYQSILSTYLKIIDQFLIFFSGKTLFLWTLHFSHGLGLLKLFASCDGQISWSEPIAFLLDLDRNASPSAEISIWHGLVLHRVSLKSVKLSKIMFFFCRLSYIFFIWEKNCLWKIWRYIQYFKLQIHFWK